jgi:hypothetical protein
VQSLRDAPDQDRLEGLQLQGVNFGSGEATPDPLLLAMNSLAQEVVVRQPCRLA